MPHDPVPGSDLERNKALNLLYKPNQYTQQRQKEKKRWIWPVHLAMEATYYHERGHTVVWDDEDLITPTNYFARVITDPEGIPFKKLPAANRILTKAFDPKYQANGNYKYNPGTYIQSAGGCWWGECSFCKEKNSCYEQRDLDQVIAEIKECKKQGFREVFDDSASFPGGKWRTEFIRKLKPIGIKFSCNMRFGTFPDYYEMKKAGFRMILYGLESANQKTLVKINKGINIKQAKKELMLAHKYGIDSHVAFMIQYPWETKREMLHTINFVKHMLIKGYIQTAQCSVYLPPEGNPKYQEGKKYVNKIYDVAFSPEFWIRKIIKIRSLDDIKYLARSVQEGIKAKWRKQK